MAGSRVTFDLIVAGAGLAGMTAAVAVARRGGRVLVLEKAPEIGGSSLMSGANVWTVKDPEYLIRQCPKSDPALIGQLHGGYPRLMEWFAQFGLNMGGEAEILGYGLGRQVDLAAYFPLAAEAVEQAGGQIITRAPVYALAVEDGTVTGVEAMREGEHLSPRAAWTLLAGGGFQGDPELTARYIHPNAPSMLLRSNRASTGDTLRAALQIGAATSPSMTGFYGHLVSYPVDEWQPGLFGRISQYHSDLCALVNERGQYFRPNFDSDHYNARTQTAGRFPACWPRARMQAGSSMVATGAGWPPPASSGFTRPTPCGLPPERKRRRGQPAEHRVGRVAELDIGFGEPDIVHPRRQAFERDCHLGALPAGRRCAPESLRRREIARDQPIQRTGRP
jgi:choline dehydrogenase-like flavoprotein